MDELSLKPFMLNPNSSVEMVVIKGRCPRRGRIFSKHKFHFQQLSFNKSELATHFKPGSPGKNNYGDYIPAERTLRPYPNNFLADL